MRIIKNFFHNINDIVLAIIIVVIAAGIIYWRMGIILDYPRQLAAQQASYEQMDVDDNDDEDDAAVDASADADGSDDAAAGSDVAADDSRQSADEQDGDEEAQPQG